MKSVFYVCFVQFYEIGGILGKHLMFEFRFTSHAWPVSVVKRTLRLRTWSSLCFQILFVDEKNVKFSISSLIRCRWSRGVSPLSLKPVLLVEVDGERHAPSALFLGKNVGTQWIGGLMGPQNPSGRFGDKNISSGIRMPGRLARSLPAIHIALPRFRSVISAYWIWKDV